MDAGYAPQVVNFEHSDTIQLAFQRTPNAGVVRIQDGEREIIENLYSSKENSFFFYEVQSNRWISWGSPATYVRVILSFALLYVCFFMLVKAVIVEYRQNRSFFCAAMVVVFLLSLSFYSHFDGLIENPDSGKYLNYFSEMNGMSGTVFVYPVFIAICKFLFGPQHYLFGIIALQALLSFVAASCFYKTLRLVIPYPALCAAGTVLFAANPAVLTWNLCYMSESLSMSGATICLYFVVRFIRKPSLGSILASVCTAAVLVFVRPTFLLLLGLLLGFFIGRLLFTRQTQKLNLTGLFTSLGAFALVGVYALMFSFQYGYFSISDAMPRQMMYVCVNEGFYQLSDDPVFIERAKEAIQTIEDPWAAAMDVLSHYTGAEALEITSACREKAGWDYYRYVLRIMGENAVGPLPLNTVAGIAKPLVYQQLLNIMYFGHVYVLAIVELAVSVVTWIRRKQPQWLHLGLAAYMLLMLITTFTATNGEFIRTGSSVLPFAYCSALLCVSAAVTVLAPGTPGKSLT